MTLTGDAAVDVWDLVSEDRPVEDEVQLAELMATHTLEGAGFVPSDVPHLRAAWERLRRKYPSDFQPWPEQILAWQQRQIEDRANVRAEEHHQKGLSFLQSHQWTEASAEFQKAAASESTHAELYLDLAWLYVDGPREFRSPEQALPLALRAMELSHTNRLALNVLGAIYLRRAQLEQAIATLEQAAPSGTQGGIAQQLFLLAMCQQAQRHPAEARKVYDLAARTLESYTTLHAKDRLRAEVLRTEAEAELATTKTLSPAR